MLEPGGASGLGQGYSVQTWGGGEEHRIAVHGGGVRGYLEEGLEVLITKVRPLHTLLCRHLSSKPKEVVWNLLFSDSVGSSCLPGSLFFLGPDMNINQILWSLDFFLLKEAN